ncbi:MAG: single-stranded DNA-binding protein [Victivallales bacterium]|nr:single-stranded DNA-binding protein [Victivallales bacterium]
MSATFNKVMLLGRVSIPPQLKSSTGGTTICTFSIAINRRYRASDGSYRETADFLELSVFGKTADHCASYLKKGSAVFVEGHLKQESWQDKETGQNRHRLSLVADRVHFVDGTAPIAEAGQIAIDPEVSQALRQSAYTPRSAAQSMLQPPPMPPSPPPNYGNDVPY